jgi:hypothetical protein
MSMVEELDVVLTVSVPEAERSKQCIDARLLTASMPCESCSFCPQ